MCGIAGIYNPPPRGPVDRAVLAAMNNALFHRGPDEEGMFAEGPVGLAMRRLKIIDLQSGRQPIANEDGTVKVVFNGEIYNYRELRRGLEAKGHRFATQSDTEVLVHLYEERGEDMVRELHGMFAFAIWDARAGKLFLARDPVGIKPLFYSFKDGLFLFGSEIQALTAHPDVSRDIDMEALSDYLSFLYVPAPKTIFRDIRKLRPGHLLTLQAGKLEIRQYWDLTFRPADASKTEEDYRSELLQLARKAVQSHLMSDVPLGAFLSGGVDSSIVTALAVEETGPGLNTFSVGFDAASHNELSYAKIVADHLGTRHHELSLSADAMEELPAIVASLGEPFGDSSAIPTYHLSRFARKHVTVALAGDGGDELFAGYEWMRRQRWIDMARSMPRALTGSAAAVLRKAIPTCETKDGKGAAFVRFLDDAAQSPQRAFYRRSTCFTEKMKASLLPDGAKKPWGGYDSFGLFESTLAGAGTDFYEQMLAWDSKVYLPDDDLCKVDRMSMAHSLEVRVPVLDLPLVEWSAGVPFGMKLRGLQTKRIWKDAFRDLLPGRIFEQRKQGFSIPLQKWIQTYLPGIRRLLLDKDSFCGTLFRGEAVRRMLDLHAGGGHRLGGQIYLLLVLELWARNAAQGRTGSSVAGASLQEVMA